MASPIKDFYRGKNILLTGATGYFGKMIIEKLLRTTEVNSIYLIVRPKQDIGFEKRVTKMYEEEIFSRIPESLFLDKLHPIEGDLRKKCLGISEQDKSILRKNIHIVFHCGASLNMDSKLVDAVMTNVNGTAEILCIMKESQTLQAFILVSTAYSNCLNKVIEENFYEPPINPKLLIRIAEGLRPELLNNISRGIMGKWPNTYSFTKAVSENILVSEGKNLPVALFRPTIVTSTVSEPVPGWCDNLYGPLGILLSSNCGILRVIRGNPRIKADTVPGDLVINGLLCMAWDVATQWGKDSTGYSPCVINFSGSSSPLYMSIREYTTLAANSGYMPFGKTVWNPMLFIVQNKWTYFVLKFMLHTTPAFLFDSIAIIIGQKPRGKDSTGYSPCVINFSGSSSPLYMSIREYTTLAANSGYMPFGKTVWNPMLFIVQNKWTYFVLKFMLHTTPAFLFDSIAIIIGQKPRMAKIYSKLDKVMGVLYYFLVHEWAIKNGNVKALWGKLSPSDRITYNFDVTAIKRETYLRNVMEGLKKYTLREDMTKVQYHKKRYDRLVALHNILKYICTFFICYRFFRRLASYFKTRFSRLVSKISI